MSCRGKKIFLKHETGQAIVEFCFVFPVLFLIILTIVQASQLFIAKQMVNYAAFCAARSAMVWLGENPEKAQSKATRAAVIACIPISPSSDAKNWQEINIFADDDVIENLKNQITDSLIQSFLSSFDCFSGLVKYKNRFAWSEELTKVVIYGSDGNQIDSGDDSGNMIHKDVTVVVTYDYALRIPLINKIFFYLCSSSELARQERYLHGDPKGGLNLNPFSEYKGVGEVSYMSYYTLPIQAHCTLTVEGKEKVEDKKG